MPYLDIVSLIEKNPLNKFSETYQSRFVQKLKESFSDSDQQLFLGSFYAYLNHDSNEFVIDLDDIWKWLGFSRKCHCKVVLEKNFQKDIDYKINQNENFASEVAEAKSENEIDKEGRKNSSEQETRGGYNKEQILMTIKTFKKLCLKSNTKKADQIHEYFIRLEEILHQIVSEEAEDLKNKFIVKQKELELKDVELERKEILLKKKEKQIKDLTNKVSDGYVYVGINEGIKGASRIGITENILKRNDSHLSSNPGFKFVFTHRTKNNKLIESCIKAMLSPFVYNKAEWYSMSHEDLIYIVKFFIEMFDTHNGTADVKNIIEFLRQLKQKNVIVKETHEFIPSSVYAQFFQECIEFRKTTGNIGKLENTYKCPFIRLQEKLDEWLTKKDYSFPIKTEAENYTHAFRDDIQAYVKAQFKKDIETINLICTKNNIRCSNYLGYIGFRIKDDFVSTFYPDSVYSKFVNDHIIIDNTKNTTKKEIAEAFEKWVKDNQIFSAYERDPSSSKIYFYDELTKAVEKFTGIAPVRKVTNKRFSGYPGFRGLTLN